MGVMEAVKGMGELVKRVHEADIKTELQQKLIDLQTDCLALQEKLGELRSENDDLRREIEGYKKRADVRSKIKMVREIYVLTDDLGERPICPSCFEKSDITIPLTQRRHGSDGICPSCKAIFQGHSRVCRSKLILTVIRLA